MAKLNTVAKSATHHVLVFGDAKTGKTQLVGDLSSHFNLLWFDLESGVTTLYKLPEEQQARIELIAIPDSATYPIAGETLLKVLAGNPVAICEAHGKVSCPICKKSGAPSTTVNVSALKSDTILVIDSLTQLASSVMSHITREAVSADPNYKLQRDDFGNQGTVLMRILSQIQAANYNVVCITHVIEAELEDGKKKLVPNCGTRNLSATVAKYFDHVIYTQVANMKHAQGSTTTYMNNVQTGSRTDMNLAKGDTLLDIFLNHKPSSSAPASSAPAPAPASAGQSSATQQATTNLAALKAKALLAAKAPAAKAT